MFPVGEQFPIRSRQKERDEWKTTIYKGELFITYYIKAPKRNELEYWELPFRLGVYIEKEIPYCVMELQDEWTFDAPLNMLTEPPDMQRAFLKSKLNTVNILLINIDNEVVLASREIQMEPDVINSIRVAATNQLRRYTIERVEDICRNIEEIYSMKELMRKSKARTYE
jgi:hypothetical protein